MSDFEWLQRDLGYTGDVDQLTLDSDTLTSLQWLATQRDSSINSDSAAPGRLQEERRQAEDTTNFLRLEIAAVRAELDELARVLSCAPLKPPSRLRQERLSCLTRALLVQSDRTAATADEYCARLEEASGPRSAHNGDLSSFTRVTLAHIEQFLKERVHYDGTAALSSPGTHEKRRKGDIGSRWTALEETVIREGRVAALVAELTSVAREELDRLEGGQRESRGTQQQEEEEEDEASSVSAERLLDDFFECERLENELYALEESGAEREAARAVQQERHAMTVSSGAASLSVTLERQSALDQVRAACHGETHAIACLDDALSRLETDLDAARRTREQARRVRTQVDDLMRDIDAQQSLVSALVRRTALSGHTHLDRKAAQSMCECGGALSSAVESLVRVCVDRRGSLLRDFGRLTAREPHCHVTYCNNL